MDELDISGKRHLSTRRAARENGYHSDYVGQLIRSGKVAGQKIGRAWYVEEESLAAYFGKEPRRLEQPEQKVRPEEAKEKEEPILEPEPVRVPIHIEAEPEIAKSIGLTYLPDDEAFFPVVSRHAMHKDVPITRAYASAPVSDKRLMTPLFALSIIALCALAAGTLVSLVGNTIIVADGKTASAGWSVNW